MATAILRSQDCLRDRFPRETLTSFPSSSSSFQSKHGRNPNRIPRSGGRRKRSPSDSESERSSTSETSMVMKFPAKDLVMGQVKILKRGEQEILNNNKNKEEQKSRSDIVKKKVVKFVEEKSKLDVSDVFSSDRLGPEPDMIPKEIRLTDLKETFAGSVIISSPSPNSLPFPSFTKQVIATKDLQRILGINLL